MDLRVSGLASGYLDHISSRSIGPTDTPSTLRVILDLDWRSGASAMAQICGRTTRGGG